MIFGPKPKDWSIKRNKKEKRLAMASAAVNTIIVEDFAAEFAEKPRMKDFLAAMKMWGLDPKEKAMFLMTEVLKNVMLSSRNIGTLKILSLRMLNLYDILNADKLVLTLGAMDYLNERYGVDYQGVEGLGLAVRCCPSPVGNEGLYASKVSSFLPSLCLVKDHG